MLLRSAAERQVLFVGGKGGVGKTTVASAIALRCAQAGRRTLIASTDPAHNLGHLWQCRIGDEPVPLAPLLRGLEIDPERTAREHLRTVGATMQRLMPEHLSGEINRYLDLAQQAPGTHEAAVLERIAEVLDNRESEELIIFDTAPSGHTARLMALPELMQAWTDGLLRRQDRAQRFGRALRGLGDERTDRSRRGRRDAEIKDILDRRRRRFAVLRETLRDQERSAFVIVLAAERLPVLETIDLHRQVTSVGLRVDALVVNRRSPADAGDLLAARHLQEEGHLSELAEAFPDLPTIQVPLLPQDVLGEEGLIAFAHHLP